MHLNKLLKKTFASAFILTIVFSMFHLFVPKSTAGGSLEWNHEFTREELAYYWAPVWYQDVDNTFARGDYITKFDYDGDLVGNNNWDNIHNYPLNAYVYYSVVETSTHWFLGYYDFHPRDWSLVDWADLFGLFQHENDMEGLLIVISKRNEIASVADGDFLCMITQAHGFYFQYRDKNAEPSKWVTDGHEDIDGDVEFSSFDGHPHPIAYVESKGHGVYGGGDTYFFNEPTRWEQNGFPGGDGVIYYPRVVAEIPSGANDPDVSYALLDIAQLWDIRFGPFGNGQTFAEFGVIDGNDYKEDGAEAPWHWDQQININVYALDLDGDGPTFAGEIFYNPADFVDVHLDGLGVFDHSYTYNPYAVVVTIDSLWVGWDRDPPIWPFVSEEDDRSDAYFNLYLFDGKGNTIWLKEYFSLTKYDGVLDGDSGSQRSWIGENTFAEWIDMHTELVERNLMTENHKDDALATYRPARYWFYGIRYPNKPIFGIDLRDWDFSINQNDWLMGRMEGGEVVEEGYTHWYGPENVEGQRYYDWGPCAAYITVMGDIPDDDNTPPSFIDDETWTDPEGTIGLYTYLGNILFSTTVFDLSGIMAIAFRHKGTSTDWSSWDLVQGAHYHENYPTYETFTYSMDYNTWRSYQGQTIYFQWEAQDADFESMGDYLSELSPVYEGPHIEQAACNGQLPSSDNGIVAFVTHENKIGPLGGRDLNGDGDRKDVVLRYLNLSTGVVTSTNITLYNETYSQFYTSYEPPSVSGNIIAFCWLDNYDTKMGYYDTSTGEFHKLTYGNSPQVSGNLILTNIVFGSDVGVAVYNITSGEYIDTGVSYGDHGHISNSIMAFKDIDGNLSYHNLSSGDTVITDQVPYDFAIDNNIIALVDAGSVDSSGLGSILYYNITDGTVTDTMTRGRTPAIKDNVLAWQSETSTICYYDIATHRVHDTGQLGQYPSVQHLRTRPAYRIPESIGLLGIGGAGSTSSFRLLGEDYYVIAAQAFEDWAGIAMDLDLDETIDDWVVRYVKHNTFSASTETDNGPVRKAVGGLVLGFDTITKSGVTSVTYREKDATPLPRPRKGLATLSDIYDIDTTAEYGGPVDVEVPYDEGQVGNWENLQLMEFDSTMNHWKGITTEIDGESQIVKGEISKLPSTIAVMEWMGTASPVTVRVGDYPSLDGNIIAFQTSELQAGLDLNGDGDTNDSILQYYDLSTKNVTNTGLHADHLSISGDIIAYDSDLRLGYYNITSGQGTLFEWPPGDHPSLSGNTMAFQVYEEMEGEDYNLDGDYTDIVIGIMDITTGDRTSIICKAGLDPSNSHGIETGPITAFTNCEFNPPRVGYEIFDWEERYPAVGEHPSVSVYSSSYIIAFQTKEEMAGQDLNGDGDTNDSIIQYYDVEAHEQHNTGIDGLYPSVSGNLIAFITGESAVGRDLNHDGDKLDSVLQYYDISTGKVTNTAEAASRVSVCGNVFAFSTPESMINQDLNGDEDQNDTVIRYVTRVLPQPSLPPTSGRDLLIAQLGGAVTNLARKVAAEVPAGALLEDTIVSVDAISEEQYIGFLLEKKPSIVSTEVYKIGPCGTTLTQFAQFTLTYDETKVGETEPEQLQVYSSTNGENWQREQVQFVDTNLNIVRFRAGHFGYFAILRDTEPATTEPAIGTPQHTDPEGNIHVSPSTMITITATDTLSGPMYAYYRINNGVWNLYDTPFNLTGPGGTYTIDYFTVDFARNLETYKSLTVILPLSTIESCDSAGTKKDTFLPLEEVYARGSGFAPSTTYNVYVVEDIETWIDHMPIPSRVSSTTETITSDTDGNIAATRLWSAPIVQGKYDIVVDYNGDGIYDSETDALDSSEIQVTAGFDVIPEAPWVAVVALGSLAIAVAAYVRVPKWRRKKPSISNFFLLNDFLV